jgi:hypothetical protein
MALFKAEKSSAEQGKHQNQTQKWKTFLKLSGPGFENNNN